MLCHIQLSQTNRMYKQICALYLIFVTVSVSSYSPSYSPPYTVPDAKVEVFHPRGLRVSIPDHQGVRLFAFHGVINREMNGLEAGDLSKDILKKTNGRWVFEDRLVKMNPGDVLNYWLFVIIDNLGYRLDDQTFVCNCYENDSINSLPSDKPTCLETYVPTYVDTYPDEVVPQTEIEPTTQHTCNCPKQPATTTRRTTPHPPIISCPPAAPPATSTTPLTPTKDYQILANIITNLTNENNEFRKRVQVINAMNEHFMKRLVSLGDENLNKLNLSGKIPPNDSPMVFVQTVLKEKLGIMDNRIIKSAVRNCEAGIIFETRTFNDKIKILLIANEKLKNSKISITDVDTNKLACGNSDQDHILFEPDKNS